jgi:hypothetical protein
MLYTPLTSFDQAKTRRVSNKSSLDRPPVISPILISRAASIERRRVRHQQRLEAYTLLCLLHFAWVVTRRVSELKKMSPRQAAYVSTRLNNAKPRIAADLRAAYRLERLREYHQRSLPREANNIIADALYWYEELCQEMRERRESVSLLAFL